MKPSRAIKPISELKAHASEIVSGLAGSGETFVITQNGEAKAVLQDIQAYEDMQETLALLKILAQSQQSAAHASPKPVREVFAAIRKRAARRKP